MKSEKEIRQHRDELRKSMGIPCNCAATGHADECTAGQLMGAGALAAMSWLLDEEPGFQRVVDHTHNAVLAYEAKQRRN